MAETATTPEELKELLRGLTKTLGADTIELLMEASAVGWKTVVTSNASVSIIAPPFDNPPKRLHFSARGKGRAPTNKMHSTILRYGDPIKVALLSAAAHDVEKHGMTEDALQGFEGLVDEMARQAPFEVDLPEGKAPKHVKKIPTPAEVAKRAKSLSVASTKPHIMSELPYLAHYSLGKRGGRSYPSQTTVERKWSDGTIDYICAVEGCGKVSENPRSFRGSHWSQHIRNGEAERQDKSARQRDIVDDPTYTEKAYTFKREGSKARALAEVIRSLDLTKMSPEELAEFLLDWLQERRGSGEGTSEPLTDAQVLDRIRGLVDRGTYHDLQTKVEDLAQQMDDMVTEYAEIEAREVAALARAVKAEERFEAFRQLVNEAAEEGGTE